MNRLPQTDGRSAGDCQRVLKEIRQIAEESPAPISTVVTGQVDHIQAGLQLMAALGQTELAGRKKEGSGTVAPARPAARKTSRKVRS